jgi:glycosyltransferase involved in cell wall biosynthesis
MNVLIVAPSYPSIENPYGGIFIHEQIKAMKRVDPHLYIEVVKVEPYVPKMLSSTMKKYEKFKNSKENYLYDGITVNVIKVLSFPKNILMANKCKRTSIKLQKYLKNNNKTFDVIHAHGAVHTGFAAVDSSQKNNLISVITAHGSDIMFYPDLNKSMKKTSQYILENANSIIAASEGLKKAIITRNDDVEVDVIYTGVNLNKFSISQSLKTNGRYVKFIYVGNLLYTKGIFDLIKAFEILQKRGINCELTLCGEGKEKRNIIEYCSTNSIKNVSVYGAVNNDNLPSILSNHDILVLPSHREGLGVVLIEALAMGKLVIGSNVGGIPEIIRDNYNGFLFKPKDIDNLAKTMVKAIAELPNFNPNILRESIEKCFDIDKNALRVINKYDEIVYKSME